ncbi:MAG: hypothetical protein LBF00_04345 [Mycoplasmataceae bacterium]|jgi:DNA polymerase-3 subunit delta|nr:hypothetical protein [Mycoplasmataceae bacterium]
MITIFYGDDKNTLDYELYNLIRFHNNTPIQHLYFKDNYDEILDSVCQMNLFTNDNIFIIHDAAFLLSTKPKESTLSQKLCSLDEKKIYFFILTKKNSFNMYTKKVNIKKIAKFSTTNKRTLINTILKNNHIDFADEITRQYFENNMTNNPFLIESELNKLLLTSNDGLITKTAVTQLINNSIESNVFKLTNYLLLNDKAALITLYDNLIILKYQPIELIQVIATQLFNLKLLKIALDKHYSNTKIETELNINKFVQFSNYDLLKKTSLEKINQTIITLSLLDYNIKRGLVNPYQGLKLMLAK